MNEIDAVSTAGEGMRLLAEAVLRFMHDSATRRDHVTSFYVSRRLGIDYGVATSVLDGLERDGRVNNRGGEYTLSDRESEHQRDVVPY